MRGGYYYGQANYACIQVHPCMWLEKQNSLIIMCKHCVNKHVACGYMHDVIMGHLLCKLRT